MTISDDDLSAFLDGELPPAEMKRIAAAIDADAALKNRAQALAAPDAIIKRAYASIDDEPMPAGVIALLNDGEDDDAGFHRAAGRGFADVRRWAPVAAALGAGSVFLMLVAAPQILTPATTTTLAGALNPKDTLHAALENTASGETAMLGKGREAALILTFRAADGAYCREFTLDADNDRTRAIACRGDGRWSVRLAAAEARGVNGYETASSGVAAAFDAGASALGADEPLAPETENALLQSGWRSGGD